MILHKNIPEDSPIERLTVICDDKFIQYVNGATTPESQGIWHKAVDHLFDIYHPDYIHIYVNPVNSNEMDDITAHLQDAKSYTVHQVVEQTCISVRK